MNASDTVIGIFNIGCASAAATGERISARLAHQGIACSAELDGAQLVVLTGCGCCSMAITMLEETLKTAEMAYPGLIVCGLPDDIIPVVTASAPGAVFTQTPDPADGAVSAILRATDGQAQTAGGTNKSPAARLANTPYGYLSLGEPGDYCSPHSPGVYPALRSVDDILAEAQMLAVQGVQELVLIDHGAGTTDIDKWSRTVSELSQIGIWVRLQNLDPRHDIDAVLPLMADGLILPYLDFRFLHTSPSVLRTWNRQYSAETLLKKFDIWRDACPGLEIRGSFVVGQETESAQDFADLLSWLDRAKLGRISVTPFNGLTTAGTIAQPTGTARQRSDALMNHQMIITAAQQEFLIGRILTVLVDEVDEEGAISRSYRDGVGIDGCVFINGETDLQPGEMTEVEIEHADEYDLWGRLYD